MYFREFPYYYRHISQLNSHLQELQTKNSRHGRGEGGGAGEFEGKQDLTAGLDSSSLVVL